LLIREFKSINRKVHKAGAKGAKKIMSFVQHD